ncbi:hypothetical protein LSAT2_008012 [Lamellibrachia satsuma]|nr:hypothetical protein LSAT2_008012 [Lamellibrachia satsuma]
MNIWKPLPYLIFGVLSTCAASLALFLPETLNEKLRDTVQEVETFVGIHKVATMSQMAPVEAGVSTIGVRPSPEDVTSAGNDAQSTNEPDEQGVTIVVDPASSENVTM